MDSLKPNKLKSLSLSNDQRNFIKGLLILFPVFLISAIGPFSLSKSDKNSKNISFYKVPLVCNAAPNIGCGSRAKPILLDLDETESVKEAWLNRQGTVIAVVWDSESNSKSRNKIANTIFSKNNLSAQKLTGKELEKNNNSFSTGKNWLNQTGVNELSKEEANLFAKRLIIPIKEKTEISEIDEKKMIQKISDVFYDFFVNYNSIDELGNVGSYKAILGDIHSYGEDLLGEGNMPSVNELWNVCLNGSNNCDRNNCSKESCGRSSKS
jgi:hypothetical protein